MQIIAADLSVRNQQLGRQLATLKNEIADDNDFRLAAVDKREDLRSYLLDYAGPAQELMGLDMLQIQDSNGLIVSSGHFRNEFGRDEPLLPLLLATAPGGTALVVARRPTGPFLAMARVDSLRLGGQLFHLVGGYRVDNAFLTELSPDPALAVSLLGVQPVLSSDPDLLGHLRKVTVATGGAGESSPSPSAPAEAQAAWLPDRDYLTLDLALPLVITTGSRVDLATATLLVSHPLAPLQDLLRSLDVWLGLVLLASLAGSFVLAFWISRRISRPLDELARKTADLDLDRLDADFHSSRTDEVGSLSLFLARMTARLRASVSRLREAERRATLGELARQVNHDIRNGLTPLRNVFKHLAEVAEKDPALTAQVLRERRDTVETGLNYLEDLASNYAKLSPTQTRLPCDLNAIVKETIADQPPPGSSGWVELDLAPELPPIMADPVGLRRILENLVRNARESLNGQSAAGGWVGIRTLHAVDRDGRVNSVATETPAAASGDAAEPRSTPTTGAASAEATETRMTPTTSQVQLLVADNGCGIPPEDQERIFEDFYSSKTGGSGLGLSNVRRLVADFEGTIKLVSEPGKGTVFRVSFPAADSETPDTTESAGASGDEKS
jgi:signal transduction histidine kinase